MPNNSMLDLLAEELVPERLMKSALTISDFTSGAKSNDDADRFINLVVNQSVLLSAVRVHRTTNPSGDITKLNITSAVTESATENTDSGNTAKPTNTTVSFVTKKTRSAIDITGEVTEDTVEGGGARNTIMQAMVNQIANDMENLAIEGDTSLSGSSAQERLLKSNDGWHLLTDEDSGAHLIDATVKRASFKLLSAMLRALPTQYRRNKSRLRWIMSENVALDLAEEYGNRVTDLGDGTRVTGALPNIHGIAPLVVPLMPEDLQVGGTGTNKGSFIWLADPQNFIYVVQRDVTVEWERKIRADRWEGTVFMRSDFIVENTDAIAKAINVSTLSTDGFYGA